MRSLTSQLAVNQIGSRYDLVLIASARMRQLLNGATPRVDAPDELTAMGVALKEIEMGLVGPEVLQEEVFNTRSSRKSK